jgi:hypothetical protein
LLEKKTSSINEIQNPISRMIGNIRNQLDQCRPSIMMRNSIPKNNNIPDLKDMAEVL